MSADSATLTYTRGGDRPADFSSDEPFGRYGHFFVLDSSMMQLQLRQRETWELIDELRMEVEVEETLLDDGEPVSSFSVAQQVVK